MQITVQPECQPATNFNNPYDLPAQPPSQTPRTAKLLQNPLCFFAVNLRRITDDDNCGGFTSLQLIEREGSVLRRSMLATSVLLLASGAIHAAGLTPEQASEMSAKTGRPIFAVYGSET